MYSFSHNFPFHKSMSSSFSSPRIALDAHNPRLMQFPVEYPSGSSWRPQLYPKPKKCANRMLPARAAAKVAACHNNIPCLASFANSGRTAQCMGPKLLVVSSDKIFVQGLSGQCPIVPKCQTPHSSASEILPATAMQRQSQEMQGKRCFSGAPCGQ